MAEPAWRHLLESKEAQFWALQFAGWTGWAVVGSISWIYWMPDSPYARVYALAAVLGIAITTALRYLYRAIWRCPMALRVAIALSLSYVAGGIWQVGKNLILLEFMPHETKIGEGWLGYFEGITFSFYILAGWSGLYFGIKWYQLLQAESAKVLRISAMAHQTQLRMLRYQLNPHFLFNTLNAISTLILERDAERANAMVTRLSKFLRYSLDSEPIGKVSLDQEIEALRLYLDIEKERFGDRLEFEVTIDADSRRALIPSLLLQPLVENAVKYAIAPNEDGGTIRLRAQATQGWLEVEVSDEGPGIAEFANGDIDGARGVGIANTRERLAAIYGDAHVFRIANRTPRGLSITIRVPYEVTA